MKTVLITGVAGFLGRHTARQFAREGWRVAGIDDIAPENAPPLASYLRMKLPSAQFADVLAAEKPDACVHCAGRASVPLSMKDPDGDFRENVVLTHEILDTFRRHAPTCHVIFLSSAAVYGNPPTLPVREDAPIAPLSPYGWHKRQAELLCEEFATIFGLPTTVVRIFSAYGPGLRRQVIWDICERAITTGRLTLRGTGQESRDFIHAGDVARALALLAARAPGKGEAYNLATGRETTIATLAGEIVRSLGVAIEPQFDGRVSEGEPLRWRADIERISALGFEPKISLESGLREVATWSSAELAS